MAQSVRREGVSVVVPVYNERETIEEIVNRILAVKGLDIELIVIDDGSTDGTREVLERLGPKIDRTVLHEKNMGKGAALKSGFEYVTSEITIVQDADLEYDPREYHKLIAPIISGDADVVYGSRFMGGDCHRVLYFWHYVGNAFLTLLSNILTNLNLSDMETCYKAFRTSLLKQIELKESRFGFEPEITAKVARAGGRIYEVGIAYHGRTYAQGKKINVKDGIRAIYCILRYNLFPGRKALGRRRD